MHALAMHYFGMHFHGMHYHGLMALAGNSPGLFVALLAVLIAATAYSAAMVAWRGRQDARVRPQDER